MCMGPDVAHFRVDRQRLGPLCFYLCIFQPFPQSTFFPSLSNKILFSSLLFFQAYNIKMCIANTFSLPTFFERHDSSLGKSIQLFIQFAGKRVLRSQLFLFAVSTLKTVCASATATDWFAPFGRSVFQRGRRGQDCVTMLVESWMR